MQENNVARGSTSNEYWFLHEDQWYYVKDGIAYVYKDEEKD